jgi:hypothetical protein
VWREGRRGGAVEPLLDCDNYCGSETHSCKYRTNKLKRDNSGSIHIIGPQA